MKLKNGTLYKALKGAIGERAGTEFYGFMKVFDEIPNPEDILLRGLNKVPEEHSQLYALTGALVGVVRKNPTKVDRFIEYSMKLPKEFSVLMLKDAIKTEVSGKIIASKEYDKWVTEHYKDMIDTE